MKKTVAIAMSGGVDSSSAAVLLKQQGYKCIGIHMKHWIDPFEQADPEKCCSVEDILHVKAIAEKIGIPLHVFNAAGEFKKQVVDYFLDEYSAGRTPNPCVECNRSIKFGELWRYAKKLGADFLATGHYAKIKYNKNTKKPELWIPKDKEKDQTYFLHCLSASQLGRTLFPLADFTKDEVYKLAKKFDLPYVLDKPQSQGVCFFSSLSPQDFLKKHLPKKYFKKGSIYTVEGKKIGTHKGLPLYTIGQREGIGIGGISGEPDARPFYVVAFDRKQNRLIVGHEKDLYADAFLCSNPHFIEGAAKKSKMKVSVRIRYRAKLVPAEIEIKGKDCIVRCGKPVRAVCPGQSAVFYSGEKLLGGAVIEGII